LTFPGWVLTFLELIDTGSPQSSQTPNAVYVAEHQHNDCHRPTQQGICPG